MSFLLPAFKWVLYSSAMAGILAIVIILLKLLIGNKLNVKWHYWVWLLVIFRLLVPYAPESSFSALNLLRLFSDVFPKIVITEPINHINDTVLRHINNDNQPALSNNVNETTFPDSSGLPNSNSTSDFYLQLLCAVWLAGVAILGFFTLVKGRRFLGQLKNYRACTDDNILKLIASCQSCLGLSGNIIVLETDNYKTPFVSGFIRPKLLLPAGMGNRLTNDELKYVVLHELAHLKRKDTVINYLIGIIQIIHWFNPVLWYAFSCWREDSKIACDAYVLYRIGAGHAHDYGQVIIKMLESCSLKNVYGVIGLLGGKSQIKRRIKMISLFNKHTYKWSVLSITLIIVLGAVLLTNAKAMEDKDTIVQSDTFLQDVDKDIADSFHLSLVDLKKVNKEPKKSSIQTSSDQQEDQYTSTMLRAHAQVMENQGYGDVYPNIYLQQDGKNGYIFQKKADGTNYLHTIAYNQGWAIVKTESVQGKKIAHTRTEEDDKIYSPLSEAQLQKYLAENSISPLVVQNIGKYTVVLYKIDREAKSDHDHIPENIKTLIERKLLSADQDGNIINCGGGCSDDNSDITPVSTGCSGHDSVRGYIGFSKVIINDPNILKDAYAVKCCYENNITTTTLVDNHNAFIIPYPHKKAKLSNVIIANKDGKILFDQNQWQKDH
jgi:Antirepressor regulating drug resistance, predicted signal transduction N-terminal membrane component